MSNVFFFEADQKKILLFWVFL